MLKSKASLALLSILVLIAPMNAAALHTPVEQAAPLEVQAMAQADVTFISETPLTESVAAKKHDAIVPAVNASGRYILSGTVTDAWYETDHGEDVRVISIVDSNGEEWCATGYDCQIGQKVTLVMNSNGTTNDIFDDIIEDVLWCNCLED
jgi:hypothetical protein|nr:MAG TPA: hypothetical protein [Bacteriophage sp.]